MPNDKPITYRPVPFNFVDLETKAMEYLTRVKAEAVQVTAEARNEVARLRETTLSEIRQTRMEAEQEAQIIRKQLQELHEKLHREEEIFRHRKSELESEALKLKEKLQLEEDAARKNGYDEGKKTGYEEGFSAGYTDGETQALTDYTEKIRKEAEIQLGAKLETLFPALQDMSKQLEAAKQSFLQLWEQSAVKVAAAIAKRAVIRELPNMIDVPLKLLREVLELGAGNTSMRIRLNTADYESLKPQMTLLIRELCASAKTEIVPDEKITSGGCVLETALGVIDNRIETRIDRIEEELSVV
ncbi:MAG: FliH/SctL family protein [Planctomycetaceae bacterium]|nr:FliH/SctL family protein [Planctomycetaceae bacterium]